MRIASYFVVSWSIHGTYKTQVFARRDLAEAFAGNKGLEADVTNITVDPIYMEHAV